MADGDRSSLSAALKRWLRGSLFCGFWLGSICSGFLFLYCPLLPLLVLNQKLFRRITDTIFAAWEMYPVAMMECFLGMRVLVTGDRILPQDRSILVMNHRTRLDWNFLWAAMFHACQPLAHRLKFVLKNPIRHVPGPGWVMQMNCFLYIHRRWERDKELLARALDYFSDIDYTYQVLLFPEGTDLTPKSRQRSHQFAESHHLQRYQQVLHPKTTGFVFLAQRMRQRGSLDAVYDLSIGYPYNLPQSEIEIIKGNFPQEVHFHITRYPSSCLPTEDGKLRDWLAALWRQKEATLTSFYKTGSFVHRGVATPDARTSPPNHASSSSSSSPSIGGVRTPRPSHVCSADALHLPNLSQTPPPPLLRQHDSASTPPVHDTAVDPHPIPSPDYSDLKTPTTPSKHLLNHHHHHHHNHLPRGFTRHAPGTERADGHAPGTEQADGHAPGTERSNSHATGTERSNSHASRAERSDGHASREERFDSHALHLAFMFWTGLCLIGLYTILTSTFVQYYALVNCILIFVVSTATQGLNNVEISLHELKKKCVQRYQETSKVD